MADSLSNWLALREPADVAARSTALTEAVAGVLSADRPLRVLDLATGTGSNVRYLTGRLPDPQHWLVVDRDPVLLAEVPARMSAWANAGGSDLGAETRRVDLGALADADIFSGRHLVTASALLDLVSEAWLRTLAARCRESGAAALFALTYNGQFRCSPAEPEDDAIRELMNRHQKTDKGLGGPAAGPDAAACAARCFAEAGYHVRRDASDWVLPPEARELQRQLIEGWADAAAEIAPEQSTVIHDWLARRLAHVESGSSRVIVCHEDLAAWLPRAGR
jgi:hypothetical protein